MQCSTQFIGATLNGVKKTAYFDTNFATGKIRITPLNLNQAQATGSTLCIQMKNGGERPF